MSSFENIPLEEDNRPSWKIKVFKKLPRGFAMHVAGLLQAYGRPIRNRW